MVFMTQNDYMAMLSGTKKTNKMNWKRMVCKFSDYYDLFLVSQTCRI